VLGPGPPPGRQVEIYRILSVFWVFGAFNRAGKSVSKIGIYALPPSKSEIYRVRYNFVIIYRFWGANFWSFYNLSTPVLTFFLPGFTMKHTRHKTVFLFCTVVLVLFASVMIARKQNPTRQGLIAGWLGTSVPSISQAPKRLWRVFLLVLWCLEVA
jgi:hypothetical protein